MGIVFSFLSRLLGGTSPRNKYVPLSGITLYDNNQSPCAQRVRIALLEKGLSFRKVEVDLLAGEQLKEEYRCICPNRKVPAIAFAGVSGVEDCVLFESNVITEFLDSDLFPGPKLYPTDPLQRAQVKMWQDWEMSLVDDFVPLIYGNMLLFILQLRYGNKSAFLKSLPPNILPAKRDFWIRAFDGELATTSQLVSCFEACYQHLTQLEKALSHGQQFLVGNRFTAADLSVFPRVAMFAMAGASISPTYFPAVCAYIKRLEGRYSFKRSWSVKTRLMRWMMLNMDSWIIRIGNWRSGRKFQRLDGSLFADRDLRSISKITTEWDRQVRKSRPGMVLVTNHICCPESWQVQLLLKLKKVEYQLVKQPAYDVIGCWSGSSGLIHICHNGLEIFGIRAVLDYIDATFNSNKRLFPRDPLLLARTQCWQALDQTMAYQDLGQFMEANLVSKFVVREIEDSNFEEILESLKRNPRYKSKYSAILFSVFCGLDAANQKHQMMHQWFLAKRPDIVTKAEEFAKGQKEMAAIEDRLNYLEHNLKMAARQADMEETETAFRRGGFGDYIVRSNYIVGSELTIADLILFCRICFLLGLGAVDFGKYPGIAEWFNNLQTAETEFRAVSKDLAYVFNTA